MDKLQIMGGQQLNGTLRVSGAKNAALPILAATLLTSEPVQISKAPHLQDVTTMIELLVCLGADVMVDERMNVQVTAADLHNLKAPYELVKTMRASFLVLGPLLARYGRAEVSLPGGCAIGSRPVDQHLKGLQAMGAQIEVVDGYVNADAPKGLVGAEIYLDLVTVGDTENLMMAACLAHGQTRLHNAACEPEIIDLGNFLQAVGVEISGHGTSEIVINGSPSLGGGHFQVMPDRIEAGTYSVSYTHLRAHET